MEQQANLYLKGNSSSDYTIKLAEEKSLFVN